MSETLDTKDLPVKPRHFVFIYPQIKKLTGAQRLILALAGAICKLGDYRVTLLTHRFAPECRPALPPEVQLIETKVNLNRTSNHYLDSLIEYGSVPFLLKYLLKDADAICFFGPPSLPGLWWGKHVKRLHQSLLYFCYEPPRAAYTDRGEVSQRMGLLGKLVYPLFGLYRPIDSYLAHQADAVLVNGQYGQSLIAETYRLNSTIITHGFELPAPTDVQSHVESLRARYNLAQKAVILTVNHLHPRKRIDLLLKAMPQILAEQPNAVALIVGQGPEEANLRKLAVDLNLSDAQVIFAGFVPEAELAAYYRVAQLYAHLGKAESFGLAVLEASASGLPVVAANEGGPREILSEGETGFLVAANPESFAERIVWLLQHPKQASQIGQAGAASVSQRYTWEQGARDFIGVTEKCLAKYKK